MKSKCAHKRIKIVTSAHYIITGNYGWTELQEEDIDMNDYLVQIDRDKIVCEDCAEVLDS